MLVRHRFECTLPDGTDVLKVKSSNWNDEHDLENPSGLSAEDYNFEAQTPGGSLTGGVANVVTLTPVPLGVNGSNTNHYLYISGGTGTPEAVLITGGSAVSEASSGTVIFTPANSHSGSWTIQSATAGAQEAIKDNTQNYTIYFPIGEVATYAPITVDVEHSRIRGSGNSQIRNEVGVMFNVTAGFCEISHLCLVGLRDGNTTGIITSGIQGYYHHLKMLIFTQGIRVTGGFHNMFSYIFMRNIKVAGVRLEDGVGHTLSYLSLASDTGTFPGCSEAAVVLGTEGCMLSHLDILHPQVGILIQATTRNIEWAHITNSYLDNCIAHCVLFDNSSIYYIRGIIFDRVWMASSGHQATSVIGDGIYTQGTGIISTIEFNHCWILNHTNENVKLLAGTNIRFIGCRFMGSNTDASATVDNVYCNTPGTVIFTDCQFGDDILSVPTIYRSQILADTLSGPLIFQDCEFSSAAPDDTIVYNLATTTENVKNYGFNRGLDDIPCAAIAAATLTLPTRMYIQMTGTTQVNTINAAWQGRVVAIRNADPSSVTFGTSGNIPGGLTLASGEVGIFEYWGTYWKARK